MGNIYAVPRIPRSIVHRARLSAVLQQGAPLIVVRGAPGAGKTTAVADWAQRAEADGSRGVWLTVDAADGDRGVFWQVVVRQLDDAGLLPQQGPLRELLLESGAPPELRRMLVRGFSAIPHDLLLILDDLHHAEDGVLEEIAAVLTACRRIRVIALTRNRSLFDAERITMTLEPVVLSTRDLLFTREETWDLVRIFQVPDADGVVAETVRKVTGGLPLAVRGTLLAAGRDSFELTPDTIRQHIETVSSGTFADVWNLQGGEDPEVDATLRLSIAEVITVPLAASLTGRSPDDAARLLSSVEGAGLGWWASEEEGAAFTFSTEVRDGMRRELHRRFPQEVAGLRRTVMTWSLDHERELEAFQHALALRDYAFANQVLMRAYWKLLPHRGILIAELSSVSKRTLGTQPLLAILYALVLNAEGAQARASETFAIAIVASRTTAPTADPSLKVVLATIEATALRVTGRFSRSLEAARRTAALLEELTHEQREGLSTVEGTVLVHTGLSFFYAAERERAHEFFLAACEVAHPASRLQGLSLTAGSYALQGHMPEAQAAVEACEAGPWPKRQIEGYPGAMYQVAAGLVAAERGDYPAALARVDVMEAHLETIEHWPLFMYLKSLAHMGLGGALAGATQLEMALLRSARPSVAEGTKALLDATLANLHMAAGQNGRAEECLAWQPAGSRAVAVARARLQLILGNPDGAARELRGAEPGQPRPLAETLLLASATRLRMGREGEAIVFAERALSIMRDRGLTTPFRLLPASDAAALVDFVASVDRLAPFRDFTAELAQGPNFMPAAPRTVQLTDRELVVLRRLAGPASLSEIAAELYVSLNTVKSQVRSIYKKLGVSSRDEAVAEAGRFSFLDA
ncbi:AAA family ATPase [Salinibacterium sp. dk2585]|uniref:LuxR C-terminal-related transcriptional regulator n=1 Tax=unclassified Salinibacterium TaxID=2632331 RepID=UPI0011C249AD|nr:MULTISPECIES: LuxR C-terminal-related transcriptional regulator [unclassified Salinibacterium]QEE60350.1 AAA family ATPase [Salinibacterium sp. dk2585]TXK55423.1 AAA family ATPase [Salinibacterium sp. dk5596]